jgi:hypothetical protein
VRVLLTSSFYFEAKELRIVEANRLPTKCRKCLIVVSVRIEKRIKNLTRKFPCGRRRAFHDIKSILKNLEAVLA